MHKNKAFSEGSYAHYVTYSCYKRRKLLNPDICKRIVLGNLVSQLKRQEALCVGFVVMPDHVHAILWFPKEHQIELFMEKWKDMSSRAITQIYAEKFRTYSTRVNPGDPIWQVRYYDFNIHSDGKLREKLDYMHNNPVCEGLAKDACDYPWSSAQGWHQQKSVGVPLSWPP